MIDNRDEWLKANKITKCPSAAIASGSGSPSPEDQELLRRRNEAQESARKPKVNGWAKYWELRR